MSDSITPSMSEKEVSTATSTTMTTAIGTVLPPELKRECLSRLSRRFHANLIMVSKEFNDFLSSSELYTVRKKNGVQEPFTVVEVDRKWFSLLETINRKKLLVEFPMMSHPLTNWKSSLIGVGSQVLSVGGSFHMADKIVVKDFAKKPPEGYDNEYRMAHSVTHSALGVIGGKVYALGLSLENMVYKCQTFDLESGLCESISVSSTLDPNPFLTELNGFVINRKLYVHSDGMGSFVFDPLKGRLEKEKTFETHSTKSACVIDNEIYCLSLVHGAIYVFNGLQWKLLQNIIIVGDASRIKQITAFIQ